MALGVTIMVIVILALMWKSAKGKNKSSEQIQQPQPIKESVQQDEQPTDLRVEELMSHLILLFNTSLNKWVSRRIWYFLQA